MILPKPNTLKISKGTLRTLRTIPGVTAAGTQELLHLVDHLCNHAARFAGFEQALDLHESGISAVETPCQDRSDVECRSRIAGEQCRAFLELRDLCAQPSRQDGIRRAANTSGVREGANSG